jgi:NAD(P)-dependent dehydrogenase (short-subunit alcohol dehydrogenase family)
MSETILITGSAGEIGSHLRASLRREGRRLVLLDVAPQSELLEGEDAVLIEGSFTDPATIRDACRGVDAVVHLGGLSTGFNSWRGYLDVNIDGTHCVLEAMRARGVPRIVYASSHHAVGYQSSTLGHIVPDYLFPRPDSLYGVSKVACESLCSLYHDRYGIDAVCVRIGSYRKVPGDVRVLWNWLSPGDCARLFEAALSTPSPGFRVVWGVSNNSRRIASLDEAALIGYHPQDNAQDYVDEVLARASDDDSDQYGTIGGWYTAPDFDEHHD